MKSQANTLSLPERADLANFLLSTLKQEEGSGEEELGAEIARRLAEIRAWAAVGRPPEEVLAELRRSYP